MFIKKIVAKKNVTINTGIDKYKLKIDDVRTLTFSDEKTYKGFIELGLIKSIGKNVVSVTKKEAQQIPVIRPTITPDVPQDVTVIESIQNEKQHNQGEPDNQENTHDIVLDNTIIEEPVIEEPARIGTASIEKDFSNYTTEQLIDMAKDAGIKRAATMKPETIIEKLKDI